MEPPIVKRGDWLLTKGMHSELTLRFYDGPPPTGCEVHWQHYCPNFYIGPVHDWAVEGGFLTVRVPHPDQPAMLVFCNVWTCYPRRRYGEWRAISFCKIVSKEVVELDGWCNQFIERERIEEEVPYQVCDVAPLEEAAEKDALEEAEAWKNWKRYKRQLNMNWKRWN